MFSALIIVCIASMTAYDSNSSLRRDVLVGWDNDRDAKRDGTVAVVKQAEKQKSQKSQMSYNQRNGGAHERHKCCNMFTTQTSPGTTFEQYHNDITTRMLAEHATLVRHMQTLLTLRGRNLHRLMNASLAITPEWTLRAASDTRHALVTKRTDERTDELERHISVLPSALF